MLPFSRLHVIHLSMFVWIIIAILVLFCFFKNGLLKIEHDAAVILSPFHLIVCFFTPANPSQPVVVVVVVTQRLKAPLACLVTGHWVVWRR